jgi:predicted  nucleic acid-binding Zn-ribbon protein
MEYLNEQIQLLTDKETGWQEEREQLQARIAQLERDLSQQRAINGELMKKMKHRRTSS